MYLAIYAATWWSKPRGFDDAVVAVGFFTSMVGLCLDLQAPPHVGISSDIFAPVVIVILALLILLAAFYKHYVERSTCTLDGAESQSHEFPFLDSCVAPVANVRS